MVRAQARLLHGVILFGVPLYMCMYSLNITRKCLFIEIHEQTFNYGDCLVVTPVIHHVATQSSQYKTQLFSSIA